MLDRADGRVDQLGAIEDGFGHHSWRKAAVDLLELLANAGCHRPAVLAGEHQRSADDDLAAVLAGGAEARRMTLADGSDVRDADHKTAAATDGCLCELLDRADTRVCA